MREREDTTRRSEDRPARGVAQWAGHCALAAVLSACGLEGAPIRPTPDGDTPPADAALPSPGSPNTDGELEIPEPASVGPIETIGELEDDDGGPDFVGGGLRN